MAISEYFFIQIDLNQEQTKKYCLKKIVLGTKNSLGEHNSRGDFPTKYWLLCRNYVLQNNAGY